LKIKLNNQDRFRFTEQGHIHEMFMNIKWQEVPGCSSIAGLFDDKGWLGWWAAGQALTPLGWMKPERGKSNQKEVLAAAKKGLDLVAGSYVNDIYGNEYKDWVEFLDKCYRAHAKETKDTAESGVQLHAWLEKFIKDRIANPKVFPKNVLEEEYRIQINKFCDWEQENKVEWLASEVQVGSLMFQFCGILDFLARINGRIVLGDFKTSKGFKDSWIPQLVGLKQCIEEMGQKIDDLMVVRLSRDGEFEVHPIHVDFERELLAFIKAKDFYQERNMFNARRKEIFPDLLPESLI